METLHPRSRIRGYVLLTISLVIISAQQCFSKSSEAKAGANVSIVIVSTHFQNVPSTFDVEGKKVDLHLGKHIQLRCQTGLYKCCKEKETMDYHGLECTEPESTVPPFQSKIRLDPGGSTLAKPLDHLPLKKAKFCRSYLSVPELYFSEPSFYLNLTEGTISALLDNGSFLNQRDFCLDYVTQVDRYIPFLCSNVFPACYRIWIGIHLAGHYISIICLLASFIIYMIFPDLRRLHGKSMMCLMISLFFTYVTNAVPLELQDSLFQSTECAALGVIIYFEILSSVFWFSVICIEMNRNFRNLRHNVLIEEGKLGIWYILYAVLCPAVLTTAVVILTLPQFWEKCWFTDLEDELYFYNAPIITITLINMLLFILTAIDIHTIKKELNKIITDGKTNEMDKRSRQRYRLFVRLWVMMGLPITVIAIGELFGCSKCYCLAISAIDMYQGVVFFLIFFCNKKVKRHVENFFVAKLEKYLPLKKKSEQKQMSLELINSSTHSTDVNK